MTRFVADGRIATFARRQHDWMERVLKGSLDPEAVAKEVQKIIDAGQPLFTISNYFSKRPNISVEANFTRHISALGMVPIRKAEDLKAPKVLKQKMSDNEISQEFLGGNAKKNAVCPSQISELIQAQIDGSVGKLLNDGLSNIFYVLGIDEVLFAVLVRWSSTLKHWDIRCFALDEELNWYAGDQVFSN